MLAETDVSFHGKFLDDPFKGLNLCIITTNRWKEDFTFLYAHKNTWPTSEKCPTIPGLALQVNKTVNIQYMPLYYKYLNSDIPALWEKSIQKAAVSKGLVKIPMPRWIPVKIRLISSYLFQRNSRSSWCRHICFREMIWCKNVGQTKLPGPC